MTKKIKYKNKSIYNNLHIELVKQNFRNHQKKELKEIINMMKKMKYVYDESPDDFVIQNKKNYNKIIDEVINFLKNKIKKI